MTPTTSSALSLAFKTALEAITPSAEPLSPWTFTSGPREQGTALHLLGTALRSFDLIFESGSESRLWYGNGVAYTCRLRIATSYADLAPDVRDHMIMDDGVDLTRMFMQLAEPTVAGFAYAVYQRAGQIYLDEGSNAMVEHLFDLHWSQNIA
ncbi:hypothetical protein [Nannocystis punicea]|uniref:Uncharacterized protein n=1 Tax=Nannocystis punicea TaxID=2995304 RepID=A0ABY7H9T9_9BACT|nr:hypothetical protein [Nannocystis poenicansa]WAS96041.1 hypothetical protein O0S08_07740 [Nannocystis poenicansa]